MTVNSTTNKVRTNGDGATVDFSFTFKVFQESDLKVYLVDASDNLTLQTITTHYTVSVNTISEGGTVTFLSAPSAAQDVLIVRELDLTQSTDIPIASNIPEKSLEDAYDKLTMISQQLDESLDRTAKLGIGVSGISDVTLPAPSDGKGLKWSGTDGTIVNTTVDIDTAITAAQAAQTAAEAAQTAAEAAQTGAETAETNAETAQTAAEAAQAAAEAVQVTLLSYANDAAFVSANGTATAGDKYFNTTINRAKLYDGSKWTVIDNVKNNYSATTDPAATDDLDSDYEVGSIWINVTGDRAYICLDASDDAAIWQQIGSGSGGGLDVYYSQNHETDASALYTVSGNNASFGGGGTLDGTLADETTNQISGDQSPKYTHGSSSTNDYWAGEEISLVSKQQNNDNVFKIWVNYDGDDNDNQVAIYDETNDEIISDWVNIPNTGGDDQLLQIKRFISSSISTLRWAFRTVTGNSGSVLIWDDLEATTNPLVNVDLIDRQSYEFASSTLTSATGGTPLRWGANLVTLGSNILTYDDSNGRFTANRACNVEVTASLRATSAMSVEIQKNTIIKSVSAVDANENTNSTAHLSLDEGDYLQIEASVGLTGVTQYLTINAISKANHVVSDLDPGANWTNFTPTASGFGAITNASGKRRRDGTDMVARQFFNAGSVGASTMELDIPGGESLETAALNSTSGRDIVGTAYRVASGVTQGDSTNGGLVFTDPANPTKLYINVNSSASSALEKDNTNALLIGATDGLVVEYRIPISGWTLGNSLQVLIPNQQVAYVSYSPASSTVGGTVSTGSYATIALDTLEGDTSFISFDDANDQFTLSKGIYKIEGFVNFFRTGTAKAKLVQDPDGTPSDALIGATAESGTADGSMDRSLLNGTITLNTSATFEIQARGDNATGGTSSLGLPASFGDLENHRQLTISKIG